MAQPETVLDKDRRTRSTRNIIISSRNPPRTKSDFQYREKRRFLF